MISEKFQIIESLHSESKEGWVWLTPKSNLNRNKFLKIKNVDCPSSKNTIIVDYRIIDDNFISQHSGLSTVALNSNTLVINAHYRKILKINSKVVNLEISTTKNWYNIYYRFFVDHPNILVVLNFRLFLWSVILSLIGIILSVVSYFKDCKL